MPVFLYEAKQSDGTIKRAKLEAKDMQTAKDYLARNKMDVKKISEEGKEGLLAKMATVQIGEQKITTKDIAIFTRQFATMIDAGLPLVQCLEILGHGMENKTFRGKILEIRDKVEGGATFADALRDHPKVFDGLFCNLVQAGEVGGILDTILNRLATYIEKADKLRRQVKGALIYPISVIVISAIIVSVILIYVIPVFQQMFSSFGHELPAPTRVVVWLSHFLKNWGWLVAITLVGIFVGIKQWRKTEQGRRITDGIFLKMPVFGLLIQKSAIARFSRTMSTMLSSGVPLIDALEICAKTSGNQIIEDALYSVKKSVTEGRSVAEPLAEQSVFPYMVVQMIGVGEATGAMDAMLGKIADFYEEEVDQAVENLKALMEPIIILVLGVVIGGIIVAMYLPIFSLVSVLG